MITYKKAKNEIIFDIAIIGAGAIGGSLAGYLIQSKQDVILIDFWPENVEKIKGNYL